MHGSAEFDHPGQRQTSWFSTGALGRFERFIDLLGVVVGVGWMLALLLPHLKLVGQDAPHEINEPGVWYATFLLDQGRNPYAVEELPGAAQFFGPFYNGVVLALKPLFGIGYEAHRLVNFFCIAGTLWLLISRMQRLGTSRGIAWSSGALFYWLCLQNIMITARPDALGLLLFTLGVLVPWEKGYTKRAAYIGLLCAFLAFHCKAYFALAALPALVGLGLRKSWRDAAIATIAFTFITAASVAALSAVFPLYLVETFVMQKNSVAANSSDEMSAMHTTFFFERAWPFLLLLTLAAPAFFTGKGASAWKVLANWREPAAPNCNWHQTIAMLAGLFLLHVALVYFYMGHNGGALFTYHLHLIFPPMLLLAAAAATSTRARLGFGVILVAFVSQLLQVRPVPDATPGYRRLQRVIEDNDPVLDSISAGTEIMATHGRPVHNNGYTLFLPFATLDAESNPGSAAHAILTAWQKQLEVTEAKVSEGDYDVILMTDDECYFARMDTVRRRYEETEQIEMPMYFGYGKIQVWKPKPLPLPLAGK